MLGRGSGGWILNAWAELVDPGGWSVSPEAMLGVLEAGGDGDRRRGSGDGERRRGAGRKPGPGPGTAMGPAAVGAGPGPPTRADFTPPRAKVFQRD